MIRLMQLLGRGYEEEIKKLRSKISQQGEDGVIEEVAYPLLSAKMTFGKKENGHLPFSSE